MSSYYYSLLGMVRATRSNNEWTVEVSYKDEDVHIGQYRTEHKWYEIGKYSSVEDLNDIVQKLCGQETKHANI